MRNSGVLACALVVALCGACRPPARLDPPTPPGGGTGYHPPPTATGLYIDSHAQSVIQAPHAPPPISGGTLGVTHDGALIVAADPDRDRIILVDVERGTTIVRELPQGAEPGRVAIDDSTHFAHVILRGTGEVASVDLAGTHAISRRAVCVAPRGIALDAARSLVRVSCRDGELVSFDSTLADPTTTTMRIGTDDLRDVLVHGDELVVTRFRTAEVLRVSLDGVVLGTVVPTASVSPTTTRLDGTPARFQPSVAWRAIAANGDVILAHQRASDGELVTSIPGAYYSTGVCSGSIVQSAVTLFSGPELVASDAPNIAGVTLPVDVARSSTGEIAVVGAGIESTEYLPSVTRVSVAELGSGSSGALPCVGGGYGGYGNGARYGSGALSNGAEYTPNAIAVAYLPDGRLVVQGREPAQIRIEQQVIALGGDSVFDTGHAFFHGDAGRGTACASCHPEAGDDGRTWIFRDIGPRRTPAVPPGFLSTAPFHWSGDLPDLSHLMGTVFTERMGGPAVDTAHSNAIGSWLDTRQSDAPRIASGDAVTRGAAVFETAGCTQCHSGGMYTNHQTVDVGTGGAFQVPTLIGVSRSLPLMHDGCATTLRDRFTASCGGNAHGTIAQGDPRIDDLIAYLNTL
jgi:hypothetical protein